MSSPPPPLTASLIGATGLVGSALLTQLLEHPRFGAVRSFARRPSGRSHPRLEEHQVDFEAPETWADQVKADVAFSCLGTTLKAAGSQDAQRKVDLDYQLSFAEAAATNGVPAYALVSSAGADAGSRFFYNRIKGQLEEAVQRLGFSRVRILRPSLLGGQRRETRLGEQVGSVVLGAVTSLGLFRRYREVPAEVVARAMVHAALDPRPGTRFLTLDELFTEAGAG